MFKEKIPFRKVTNITEEKGTFTYIVVQTEQEKVSWDSVRFWSTQYYFCGFFGSQHYYEALNLMKYLWQNPPSYVELQYAAPLPAVSAPSKTQAPSPPPKQRTSDFGDWGIEVTRVKSGARMGRCWEKAERDKNQNFLTHNTRIPHRGREVEAATHFRKAIRIHLEDLQILLEDQRIPLPNNKELKSRCVWIGFFCTENVPEWQFKGWRRSSPRGIEISLGGSTNWCWHSRYVELSVW